MTMHDFARFYTDMGCSIFPCRPNDTRPASDLLPRVDGKPTWLPFQKTPPTREQVQDWWTRIPDANIALVTGAVSRVVVLDLDRGHAKGVDGLASVQDAGLNLPETYCVQTPRGGMHCYYKHPGGTVPNATALLPGVDIRGDGGYVLIPPSRRPEGVYRPISKTKTLPIAPLPDWLRSIDKSHPQPTSSGEWTTIWDQPCTEGHRNDTTAQIAGHLAAHGIDEEEALALLTMWNATRCQPPLDTEEVVRTVASIYRAEHRENTQPASSSDAACAIAALPLQIRHRLRSKDTAFGALVTILRQGTSKELALAWILPAYNGDIIQARRALRWAATTAQKDARDAH